MNAKKMLLNAIGVLVTKKPFHQIRVQEILDEAEVSRRTFYKYYKDKYELANDYYQTHVTNNILTKYDGQNWLQVNSEIINYIKDNRDYYDQLKKFRGSGSFIDFLTNYSYNFFSSVYLHNLKKDQLTRAEEYETWYVTGGCVLALEKWMDSGYDLDPMLLSQMIVENIPEQFYKYFN